MVYCCVEQGRFMDIWVIGEPMCHRFPHVTCERFWRSDRLASVGGEVGTKVSRTQKVIYTVYETPCATIQLTRNYENSFQCYYSGFHLLHNPEIDGVTRELWRKEKSSDANAERSIVKLLITIGDMTMTYLLHLAWGIAEAQIMREETPKDLPAGEQFPMVEYESKIHSNYWTPLHVETEWLSNGINVNHTGTQRGMRSQFTIIATGDPVKYGY